LRQGLNVLKARKFYNPVSSIMLLTDGQGGAPSNDELKQMLLGLDTVPVHCFGFGKDHDARTLSSIAETAHATFSYIEQLNMVGDVFATCLGGMLSVAAQNVTVCLKCEAPGSIIQTIRTEYPHTFNADKSSAEIKIPDMLSEEKKDILFSILVPSVTQPSPSLPLFSAYTHLIDPKDEKPVAIVLPTMICSISRPDVEESVGFNRRVTKERLRVQVAEALDNAVKLGEAGRLPDARECLNAAMEELKKFADPSQTYLLEDLQRCQEKFRDQTSYSSGGYAYAKMQKASHANQRAMGSQAAYANSAQMMQKCLNVNYNMSKK